MAERIYPSAKPVPHPPSAAAANGAASGPAFPATKAQTYGRPAYRPQPLPPKRRRRSGRSCCCVLCLWITLLVVALVFLAAIAGGIFYVLYRPQRPAFTVSTLRLSQFNVSSASNSLTSRLDLTVTARNPNKKIAFLYDPISISVSSDGVDIGDGSFPAFVHEARNTSVLKAAVTSSAQTLDPAVASDLKKKSNLPLQIDLETKAGVKFGGLKTKKIGIKVSCGGFSVAAPKKKVAPLAKPDVKCKVKLRIKIWKWTI